jgi:predicted metalloenzyme YecM
MKYDLQDSLKDFEIAILSYINLLSYRPNIDDCDHLCFIVKSELAFNEWKIWANEIGTIIREFNGSRLNLQGDRFLIIKIKNPLKFLKFTVSVVEIKLTNFPEFEEGWQHAEFIPKDSLQDIVDNNPDVNFEIRRINDDKNREIGIRFSKQFGLKFRTDRIKDQFC